MSHRIVPWILSTFALLVLLSMSPGCSSEGKAQSAENGPPPKRIETGDFPMPPKDLLAAVKKVVSSPPLSLAVEEEQKGSFVTGYKQYPGDFHIARRWQERTRYRINVSPDWDEPMKRSRLEVSEETQQRASDIQEWQNAPELQRPQRATELMGMIREKVKG